MNFFQVQELPPVSLATGVTIRMVSADKMMMVFFSLAPGARIPEHTHPHEQMGMVLKGSIRLTIGGEAKDVFPGMVYRIPPDVLHSGECLDTDAEVLDIFSPPREDFLEKLEESAR